MLGCGGRERLATYWLNGVCNSYYVESENVCCHIRCCKSIVLDITLSPRICVVIYEGWNFNSGNYLFTTDTK